MSRAAVTLSLFCRFYGSVIETGFRGEVRFTPDQITKSEASPCRFPRAYGAKGDETIRPYQIQVAVVAILTALLCGSATAEEAKSQGSLTVGKQKLNFKYVVAYRGESYKEPRIIVIATSQKIAADVLAEVAKLDAEESIDSQLDQSYLKAVYLANGELRSLSGKGAGSSFMTSKDPLEGKATVKDGRVKGDAKLVEDGTFAKDVKLTFDLSLGIDTTPSNQPTKLDPPVVASVKGKFTGEGKEGNLKFVSVQSEEPFNDKEALAIVFTEKDHSKSKKPGFDAGFGKLGNVLILKVFIKDGGIFGCEVAHSSHSKTPFSSIGQIQMLEFEPAGGNVKGHVSTGGEVEALDQKWEVDLEFAAPMPEAMRKALTQPKPTPEKKNDSKEGDSTASSQKKMKEAMPGLAVDKLALPANITNVEYKKLVEHITFESKLPVRELANEFSKKLSGQGWKEGSGSLIGQKNAILKRTLGESELTIMIHPKGTGSSVKIFTEGLDWSGAAKTKPAKAAASDEIDDETKKLIEKTLDGDEDGFKKAAQDLINKSLQDSNE